MTAHDAPPEATGDAPPDLPPDLPPDTCPDLPPEIPEGCPDGEHYGGDGVCVPEGTCSEGYHDGGEGICVPEGVCSGGYRDGGDGSCVPEGSCAEGHHDGGEGVCVPDDICAPGFFNKLEDGVPVCVPALVVSDPESGGALPGVFWDGTAASILWYAAGDPGKWMKVRMTFDGQVMGTPAPQAMDVSDPGALAAIPLDGGLLAAWEQSGGILRCMRVQTDGSSATTTLATDAMSTPGEARVSVFAEAEGALVAWLDQAGAPVVVRVDDGCQPTWGPEAPPLPAGEVCLGAPAISSKDGVTLVGWPADDGAGEGHHTVLAYDAAGTPGQVQTWQDGPGAVESGLRLFPKDLGFGFFALTLGPFGGGVPTPIIRDLGADGVPEAAPGAPIPTPPVAVTEPWTVRLTDDLFTAAWGDQVSGALWLTAFHGDGAVAFDPIPFSVHGPDAAPTLGPSSMAPIPGVGHVIVWASALSGQAEIYAAIVDGDGVRIH